MSPPESGRGRFRVGAATRVDQAGLPVSEHHRPGPCETGVTIEDVQSVIGGAQRLVDSRPSGDYPVAWCIEALHFGDQYAIGALAAIAARSRPTAH